MKHLKREVLHLASTYLIIIMVMSIGFSLIFYNVSVRELSRPVPSSDPNGDLLLLGTAPNGTVREYLRDRSDHSRTALQIDLIAVNLVALIVGGLLSYLLAERTLRPIEENMEAQTQFVSDASHELRTPLTALRAANEVAVRDKKLTLNKARDVLRENVDDISRLQELSNSMLGLLREDDKALFQHTVSLPSVVSDAMNVVVAAALAKNIAVNDTVPELAVRGNHQSLVQLMTILLDNAIKYSGDDTTIHIEASARGRLAIIVVRDEGVGMDEETLSHIFTRFYRAEKSRTTVGYGLGLSIARKITDAHKGKLVASSTPGKGTTFTITLPLASE